MTALTPELDRLLYWLTIRAFRGVVRRERLSAVARRTTAATPR